MKEIMREDVSHLTEGNQAKLSDYKRDADRLVEKWSRKKGIGEGLLESYDKNPDRIRATSIILENQESHLGRLTETQISTAFATTPENVMRIVRLGYPNSVRGEIFLEWAMQTAKDSIYYLYPQYGTNVATNYRGATPGNRTIESSAYRFAMETNSEACLTAPNSSNPTFTGTLAQLPVVPYTIRVYVDGVIVGTDDGHGNFPSTSGTDNVTGITTGTVDYNTTGNYSITFTTAPLTGTVVVVEYNYNSEVAANYTSLGNIELQLRDYQFRIRPYPLGVSWSKMTELLLGTTLNIDAEEALIRGAADELKKSLDYQALSLGYAGAKGNTVVNFDTDFAAAGSDSEVMHAQAITKAIDRAADVMFSAINRGGVTKMYGGPNATSYLKLHKRFTDVGAQPKVGAHKIGSLDGIDIYKVPSAIVPNDEIVCVYRNDQVPEDVSLAAGTLVPLYQTQKLEFSNLYSQLGLSYFGDLKILQPRYLARIKLLNLTI